MNPRTIVLAALAVLAIGCGNQGAKVQTPAPADGGPKTTSLTAAPVLPDSLKNSAYEYYGLGTDKLLTYSVKLGSDLVERDGTVQTTLDSVKGDVATFKIERSGEMAELGFETVELDSKGVTTVGLSIGTVKDTSLELPADIALGKEWTAKSSIQKGDTLIATTQSNKAAREEKVTVPAGTFDCLVVLSTGDVMTTGATDSRMNGKSVLSSTAYYAKGVGIVKMQVTVKLPNKKTNEIHMTLKKIGDTKPTSESQSTRS